MLIMELLATGKMVLQTLNEAGYEAYFVGGMVRDQLINRPIYDIDITTSAKPEVVMSLFEKTIATGLAHGTVTVIINKIPIEVTTFRVETGYADYRHPNEVIFTASLEDDLKVTTLLYYFEDLKYKDIAKLLKIKEGTVKSRLYRAKQKLYEILKED